jgi:hypothetical protein
VTGGEGKRLIWKRYLGKGVGMTDVEMKNIRAGKERAVQNATR